MLSVVLLMLIKSLLKLLTPIEGYEKKPLVSLKEAVAPIDTPIHNLKTMVWTAERNCDRSIRWSDF